MLALGLRSELQDLARFPRLQDFVSSGRVVTCAKAANGNRLGPAGKKIGTGPLRGVFADAALLFVRQTHPGKAYVTTLAPQPGNATALTGRAHELARAR
jgi:hypothetical protein